MKEFQAIRIFRHGTNDPSGVFVSSHQQNSSIEAVQVQVYAYPRIEDRCLGKTKPLNTLNCIGGVP